MVRSVESIQKDISALNEATITLGKDFERLYGGYLEVLGQALKRQVVLATYHLCTQVYPDAFLRLSVSQREKLQQAIRQLGQEAQDWFQQLMEPEQIDSTAHPTLPSAPASEATGMTVEGLPMMMVDSQSFPASEQQRPDPEEAEQDRSEIFESDPTDASPSAEPDPTSSGPINQEVDGAALDDSEDPHSSDLGTGHPEKGAQSPRPQAARLSPQALLQSMLMAAMASDEAELLGSRLFTGDHLTPTILAKQHLMLEQKIRDLLQRVSKQSNQILKAAQVIPDLPEAVLDAASEAETGIAKGRSTPNLLNVLVAMPPELAIEFEDGDEMEAEALEEEEDSPLGDFSLARDNGQAQDDGNDNTVDDDVDDIDDNADADPREGMMTHLAAINLRLSDIEFADVQASLWRSKLRTAMGRLRKLGKQYQQAQRELAIAEAEQAWRAVWYDDSPR